jgi:hypothetical protein
MPVDPPVEQPILSLPSAMEVNPRKSRSPPAMDPPSSKRHQHSTTTAPANEVQRNSLFGSSRAMSLISEIKVLSCYFLTLQAASLHINPGQLCNSILKLAFFRKGNSVIAQNNAGVVRIWKWDTDTASTDVLDFLTFSHC